MRACRISWRVVAAAAVAWLWLQPAFAQDASTDAAATAERLEGLSAHERTDLAARLSDEQIRDLLLHYLGQNAGAAAKPPDTLLAEVEATGETIRRNAAAALAAIDDVPAAFGATYARLAGDFGPLGIVALAFFVGLFIGVGLAAEWLFAALTRRLRESLRARAATPGSGALLSAFMTLLLDLVGMAVFAIGYVAAFLAVWQGNESRRRLMAAVLLGILAVRLTRALADFLFAPARPGSRIVPLDQEGARYFREAAVSVAIAGSALLIGAYLIGVWSEDRHVRLLLVIAAAGGFVAYFATLVWRGRHHAATARLAAAGGEPGWAARLLAQSWAGLVVAYVIVLYLAMIVAALAELPVSAASFLGALLLVVVVLPAVDGFVGLVFARRDRTAALAGGTPRDHRVFRRAARIVMAMLALLIVLRFFGVDLIATANQTLGARIAKLIFDVGLIVLVAYVLWEMAIAAINKKLAEEAAATAAHGSSDAAAASRLGTLLPLLRRALQGAILTIAALMALSSLGVNIGPLLAGAGIFGLAVGFGAQTLVKDVISGLFFLLDDAFRVGEYIEVGGIGGNVERINTRSLSLRTPNGAVHTVPFGEMAAVANYSRDWAIVKMEFKVTYDTDLGKVKRIFRRIGEELSADPELAGGFIQPFKFQGVKAMDDTGIIVRGKFMAVPGTQFQIRKQVFERVQKAFAKEGITFAQRRVQVDLPPGLDLDDQTKEEIARRAGAAAMANEPPPAR